MNLFARSLGGILSDFLYAKMHKRGRYWAQFLCLVVEAIFLFAFGCVDNDQPWPVALVVLICFSVSVQMAEGTTYGIVPFLQGRNLSYVSALVGAGGNLGAVIALWCFHKTLGPIDTLLPFKVHAVYVLVSALLTPLLAIPQKKAASDPKSAPVEIFPRQTSYELKSSLEVIDDEISDKQKFIEAMPPWNPSDEEFSRQKSGGEQILNFVRQLSGQSMRMLGACTDMFTCHRERLGCDGSETEGSIMLSTSGWPTRLKMPEKESALEVHELDHGTSDEWVLRRKEMVRLTGRHPFNAEPPLEKLNATGWVTPASLTYVRNHGPVPKLSWETHRLHITGIPQSIAVSMDELAAGRYGTVVTFPVSWICSGNRRKEQNMTKKTIGFNWGAAAVANGVWTGVRLCDILARIGIKHMSEKHQFVHFAGPKGEVPKGSDQTYGTSIPIGWALDRERDVLLAFKHNGEHLLPDHGFPLRVVLPGGTGARWIKWVSEMWVSDRPSENYYHFFDNRVLPPHIDAEKAEAEGWWYKPEYIINHININSAIFEPKHNAFFSLNGIFTYPTMKVSGYAYVGGGTKIIRAEISLDSGRSWEIADLNIPEAEIAAARGTDKHWCWTLWETEIESSRLGSCREICCRAVDANQNSQPTHLVWNVMGMMNNCIYRVKVHPQNDSSGTSGVWFEHPALAGNLKGGWMTEDSGKFNSEQASMALPGSHGVAPNRFAVAVWGTGSEDPGFPSPPRNAANKKQLVSPQHPCAELAGRLVTSRSEWLEHGIPMTEVSKRNDEQSVWMVVKDKVYDATKYMDEHPGGPISILLAAGQDATEDFQAVHSEKAWEKLQDFYIGPLQAEHRTPTVAASPPASLRESADAGFLKPVAQTMPLIEKIVVSRDTRIFRFGLPTPTTRLGLPTGMHLLIRANINGGVVMRPYTPMTDDATLGHVDLLVKVYFAGVHPRFPDGGKMSQHLESLQMGETVQVKGPIGSFVYKSLGSFTYKKEPRVCNRISLIAGGTGLTPCYQVLMKVLNNAADTTKLRLIYANNTPDEILLHIELEGMAKDHPDRLQIWHTVANVPSGVAWTYDVGFVTLAMLEKHLFSAGEGTVAMMCGPPPMTQAVSSNLQKLGYKEEDLMIM
jgi:nitrate reductase (NAD(P)H)